MTSAEIIAMAEESDIDMAAWGVMGLLCLHAFATLVAAKEREACAQICEDMFSSGALDIADAIRARNK